MARSSTTFPRKWLTPKTKVIRVPEHAAEPLLEIARKIDKTNGFRLREEPGILVLEYNQPKHVSYNVGKPINVASVPQRSPFRYPGGKTWLVPYIRDWLSHIGAPPSRLIEPFAGGAIISLTVAFERLARDVVFCELDPSISAVWRVLLNGGAEWLAKKILTFEVSIENVRAALARPAADIREVAFQTILRNRVQRGGIMAPGAGLVKQGENGRGLSSRWYPQTLARRIRAIDTLKDQITFRQGDGFDLIASHRSEKDCVFYIDPPYTLAARRLYVKWAVDHKRLFSLMADCSGDFLMSYDNTVEIATLAKKHGFEARPIAMKSTHHANMTELLIGRDLSWLS